MSEKSDNKLSPEIIEVIKAIVGETRKPTELEQLEIQEHREKLEARKRDIEAAQATRLQGAAGKMQERQNLVAQQKACQHEGGKPFHSFVVFVNDHLGGFILCQHCAAVIRMEQARVFYGKNYAGTIIFDDNKFNKLFQQTNESGIFA
jgi:hypothetical protein